MLRTATPSTIRDQYVYDRPRPRLCVDLLVFREVGFRTVEALLVRRRDEPFAGECVPGGMVLEREQPADAVLRKLEQECALKPLAVSLYDSQSDVCDDPRGWGVSNFYIVRVAGSAQPRPGTSEEETKFFDVKDLPPMVGNFKAVVEAAAASLTRLGAY
jgi:8-oxo-dGTP diphosphatase